MRSEYQHITTLAPGRSPSTKTSWDAHSFRCTMSMSLGWPVTCMRMQCEGHQNYGSVCKMLLEEPIGKERKKRKKEWRICEGRMSGGEGWTHTSGIGKGTDTMDTRRRHGWATTDQRKWVMEHSGNEWRLHSTVATVTVVRDKWHQNVNMDMNVCECVWVCMQWCESNTI